MKLGIRLIVLADSDTGYVHSIIPYYGKLTGKECNFPNSETPFTSRIVLCLMDRLWIGVSDVEGYHLFTDRYYNCAHLAQELDNQNCHTTGTTTASKKKVKLSL
jgi:hypothetical protein